MKMAYVKWLDSNGLSGRMSPKVAEELGPLPVESAGILVRDDGECVTLAQDYWRWTDSDGTEPETFRTILVIPRVLVQRLEIIEVPDKPEVDHTFGSKYEDPDLSCSGECVICGVTKDSH